MGNHGHRLLAFLGLALLSGCAFVVPPLVPPSPVAAEPFAPVLHRYAGSVARLLSTSCAGAPLSGSGFVVDEHHVLTAAHVVGGARQVSLRLPATGPLLGDVVGIDPARDTAVVRTATVLPVPPLVLAGPGSTDPGTEVAVLGYPLGDASLRSDLARVTSVTEAAVVNAHPAQDLLSVDAALLPGMSGGPALDAAGLVRGMVVASIGGRGGRDSSARVGLAVPTGSLADSLARRDAAEPGAVPCAGDGNGPAVRLELVGDGGDAELAHSLWLEGTSLNRGQFRGAWSLLTADQQAREGDLDHWSAGAAESHWTRLQVLAAARDGRRATTRARVRASAATGECLDHDLEVRFALVGGVWLVDRVTPGRAATCR